MLRRVFPLPTAKTVINTGIPPALAQFETKCLVDCGEVVNINSDKNPERTLAVWKMQTDTAGDAQIVVNIGFGSARVRVYDMPEGMFQDSNGGNVLYDSLTPISGTIQPNKFSDKPYLFIDFQEKSEGMNAVAQIQCYSNTSVVSNPEPYFVEIPDTDLTIEQGEGLDVRVLDAAIQKESLIFSTLRVVLVPSGDAIAKTEGGIITVTAPVWSGTPATYSINFKVKDSLGIDYCGIINVTTQNSATPAPEDFPECIDDTATCNEGENVTIGVLDNDTANLFVLSSLHIISAPSLGSVTINPEEEGTKTVTYNAPQTITGDQVVTFDYGIKDYTGVEYSATVTVTVYDTIPPVQLVDDTFRIARGESNSVYPLGNDDLTGLDLSTFRFIAPTNTNFILSNITARPITKNIFMKADSLGDTIITYALDSNDGLTTYTAEIAVTVYDNGNYQPPTLGADLIVLDGVKAVPHQSTVSFGQFN